jgi:SOS response regulatory protein OraA/RecX
MADVILKQQGYLRSVADVRASLNYLCRSFVPRKKLSNPLLFKKANKFLQSVKNYVERIFSLPGTGVRYKNLSDSYTFLDDYKAERLPIKEIVEINDPESLISATYKRKAVEDFDLGDRYNKELGIRRKIVSTMTKGFKHVDKSIHIRPVLKKKYSSKEDLITDLYSIYLGWFDSKSKSRDLYIELRSLTIDHLYINDFNYPTNKIWRKNFITKKVFENYLHCDYAHIPKRFWRILKFCRSAMKGKSTLLDTVSESIYTQTVVKEEDKSSNVFKIKRLHDLFRYKMNPKFRYWAETLARNLTKKGYFYNDSQAYLMDYSPDVNLVYKKPSKRDRCHNKWKAILTTRVARDFLGRFLDILAFDELESLLNSLGTRTLLNPTFEDLIGVLSHLGLTHPFEEIEAAVESSLKELGTEIKRKEWSFKSDLIFAQKLQDHALTLGYLERKDILLEEDIGILPLDWKKESPPHLQMLCLPIRGLLKDVGDEGYERRDLALMCMHKTVNHYVKCNQCINSGKCKKVLGVIRRNIEEDSRNHIIKSEVIEEIKDYLKIKGLPK